MSIARALAALLLYATMAQDSPVLPESAPETQLFVQQALQDRLNARDIPDFDFRWAETPLVLREEMPRAKQRLSKAALPTASPLIVSLRSVAGIQADADARNRDLVFLTVDLPQVDGDSASIWIGSDIAIHHQTARKIAKLCCGTGRALFKRNKDGWTFVKWTSIIVS